jgi:hypothetical protein
MRLPGSLAKVNPYLMHLTQGARSLGWFSGLIGYWLLFWIGSYSLIQARVTDRFLRSVSLENGYVIGLAGLAVSILVIVVLVGLFVFMGTQLTLAEAQSEQLTLLRSTNISLDTIFGSLLLGILYRARRWLTWLIGGCPFFIGCMCWMYSALTYGAGSAEYCYTSPFGRVYCYWDGPPEFTSQVEAFWFLSLTICILGIMVLAAVCSVGLTMRSKKRLLSAVSVLAFTVPLVLAVILLAAPEGFLFIDTAYRNEVYAVISTRILWVGLAMAIFPFAASLGAYRFLRRWAFD